MSCPEATVTVRWEGHYLRVTNPLPGGGAEQWPVGVTEGQLTSDALDAFLTQVHARFASADPSVRSEFVYGEPPVPDELAARARRANVRLRSFVEYQGLLDLRPLVRRQTEPARHRPALSRADVRATAVQGGWQQLRRT